MDYIDRIMQQDRAGGMVYCRVKTSAIALARCWQYQQLVGAGDGCPCPLAVSKEEVIALLGETRFPEWYDVLRREGTTEIRDGVTVPANVSTTVLQSCLTQAQHDGVYYHEVDEPADVVDLQELCVAELEEETEEEFRREVA